MWILCQGYVFRSCNLYVVSVLHKQYVLARNYFSHICGMNYFYSEKAVFLLFFGNMSTGCNWQLCDQNARTLVAYEIGITATLNPKFRPSDLKMILHHLSKICRILFHKFLNCYGNHSR